MNVTVSCENPLASVEFTMGEEPPVFSGGYGGFDEVARPKRSPIAQWIAPPARRLEINLMLDGFTADRSVEGELFTLSALASNVGMTEPPKIKVTGTGVPGSGLITWVVSELTWTPVALNGDGNMTRVAVSLSLLEAVDDEVIELSDRERVKRVQVKKGDTLTSIAAERLGSGSRWREIIRLNPKVNKKGKRVNRRTPKDVRVNEWLRLP